jgi:hypothetical protein
MAGLNDDAQWIIMMGFIVSFSLFFLAIVINQSTIVGQTTAESVIEFPKNDIRDLHGTITGYADGKDWDVVMADIRTLALSRKGAVVNYTSFEAMNHTFMDIHYNNGVTEFNENWTYR